MVRKSMQSIDNELVTSTIPPLRGRAVHVTKLKDAKRLLSRLITQFQCGEVDSRFAKDLCYLLTSYVSVAKDTEIEERLQLLETHLAQKK